VASRHGVAGGPLRPASNAGLTARLGNSVRLMRRRTWLCVLRRRSQSAAPSSPWPVPARCLQPGQFEDVTSPGHPSITITPSSSSPTMRQWFPHGAIVPRNLRSQQRFSAEATWPPTNPARRRRPDQLILLGDYASSTAAPPAIPRTNAHLPVEHPLHSDRQPRPVDNGARSSRTSAPMSRRYQVRLTVHDGLQDSANTESGPDGANRHPHRGDTNANHYR